MRGRVGFLKCELGLNAGLAGSICRFFFFVVLRGTSKKAHNSPNRLLKKVCTKKFALKPFF